MSDVLLEEGERRVGDHDVRLLEQLDALGATEVKDALRRNTEDAAAAGVFGVPTFVVDGEAFWGNDSVDFFKAWLADPALLSSAEMRRIDALPVAAARKS